MNTLFDSISQLNTSDDFSVHFAYLNVTKGWKLLEKLECDDETKNQLVKYVAYCYTAESSLLRKKKERLENKLNVLQFVGIEMDSFILECVQNKNSILNKYITWWLRETADRDFALLISGEDLYYSLLETSREGIEKVVTAKDEKQAEKVMKAFGRLEVNERANSYEKAMKVKASIESQMRQLEKNYQYLHSEIKKEGIEIPDGLNWAERVVLKRRNQQ